MIYFKFICNQKQSDLLLNADDLDAMWVCLRENCVIDDATGAEKVGYCSWGIFLQFVSFSIQSALWMENKNMNVVRKSVFWYALGVNNVICCRF